MEHLNSINYLTNMRRTCQGIMIKGCYAQKIYEKESVVDLKVSIQGCSLINKVF